MKTSDELDAIANLAEKFGCKVEIQVTVEPHQPIKFPHRTWLQPPYGKSLTELEERLCSVLSGDRTPSETGLHNRNASAG